MNTVKFPQPASVDDYIKLLMGDNLFSQANYGDGEFSCILGKEGQNSQGGAYYPELGKALRHTLLNPMMTCYGYNPGRVINGEVESWLDRSNIAVPEIWCSFLTRKDSAGKINVPWVHKEILPAANCQGKIGGLFRVFKNMKRVLLVGGPHLKELSLFPFSYVGTPPANSWDHFDDILKRVHEAIIAERPLITLFCLGMAAKPLIWNLLNKRVCCHLLDIGAIFDPYVGKLSRKGYCKPEFQDSMKRNISLMDGVPTDVTDSALFSHCDLLSSYLQKSPDIGEGVVDKLERTPEVIRVKLEVLDRAPSPHLVDGPVLDVGPAMGWEYVELRRIYGDRIEAVTMFEEEAKKLREEMNIPRVHVADMHSLPKAFVGRYGMIFTNHVMEHSPAPYIALSQFYNSLKVGGWLYVSLPNADGRIRIGEVEKTRRIGSMGCHVFFPSVETLIEMARRVGFSFEKYEEVLQTENQILSYRNMIWTFRKRG
jgi:SAM-dependent methyltransferase